MGQLQSLLTRQPLKEALEQGPLSELAQLGKRIEEELILLSHGSIELVKLQDGVDAPCGLPVIG